MALVDTTTGELLADLTPDEARELTETIRHNVDSLWLLLKESYDRKAWAALGYPSWREYATSEFGMSQSRAYQLLDQARVISEIEAAANSTDVEITEAEARRLKPVLDEAKAAVKAATENATPEEKQAKAREALDRLRDTLVDQNRPKDPATSGSDQSDDRAEAPVDDAAGSGDDETAQDTAAPSPTPKVAPSETAEQRAAREAEQNRIDRNVAFGKHLIGLWALLGDGNKPIDDLIDGWDPEECPAWLVEPHRHVFTPDGMRDLAATVEKLAVKWEAADV